MDVFFRDIDYFLAVCKAGSVSKAAELLFISQPSLSQFLTRLENRLGALLFDRTKKPWRLTDVGKRYAEYVEECKQLETQLTEDIISIQNGYVTKQTLTIGIPPWKGSVILPDILSKYVKRFPNVSINVHEESAIKLRDLVKKGIIDVAIMNTPFYDKYVIHEKLCDERIFLAIFKESPIIKKFHTSLTDPAYFEITQVYNQRLIIPGPDLILTTEVNNLLMKRSVRPSCVLHLNNIHSCLNLAAKGYGFTFVPEFGLEKCGNIDSLAFFTVDKPALTWSISVVYRNRKSLCAASKAFVDMCKEFFDDYVKK